MKLNQVSRIILKEASRGQCVKQCCRYKYKGLYNNAGITTLKNDVRRGDIIEGKKQDFLNVIQRSRIEKKEENQTYLMIKTRFT